MLIPEVREQMLAKADEFAALGLEGFAGLIRRWEGELHRRPPIRRAAAGRHPFVAPETIRDVAEDHPHWTYAEIAAHLNTSTGRVSEALAGFRE